MNDETPPPESSDLPEVPDGPLGTPGELQAEARRLGQRIAFAFGALLHLMIGFFYAFAGLIAPIGGVAVLWAVWIGLAAALWRWRRWPAVSLSIPFVAALAFWGIVTFGDLVLGWTA